ncbi:MAG: AAA family ATPase, partial [Candidatus ainarchaeum sp.]|nr:AAA family ATPase [Candidatus ainarchaeum sp.]
MAQQSMQQPAQQQAMKEPAQQSMTNVRIATYLDMMQKNESLWGSILVFLGALFLISSIPLYPIYIIPVLALLCGAIAYKSPPVGLILGAILAFPAVLYQSSVFGWFYIMILAVILFEAFENWLLVATLEILVLAPFSFGAFPLFGWISIAGMGIGALYFGSRKSVMIAIPSVFLILMLSSIWLVPNSAYLPVKMDLYKAKADLQMIKPAVDIGGIGTAIGTGLGKFLSVENLGKIWDSMNWLIGNIFTLLAKDSMILQLIGWAIALYLLGYLPAILKPKPQLMSSLALLILIPVYFIVGMMYGGGIRLEFIGGVIFAIAVLGGLEHLGVSISREEEIERAQKTKAYGKFGMTDMAAGKAEKSLADVGGYEDVKQELRDAIMMPLQKKDIAYAYGLTVPKGILLFGPPGTGKTMLMRALAKELKYNFIEVRCSQILSQWYGESEKNVSEVFSNARKNAPTVLFFDEIDSVAKKRSTMTESLDSVGPRVLTTMLQEMDGASKSDKPVIVIGATNLPNELDPAVLRPGRLDKIIYMHLPDPEARKAIIKVSMKKMALAPDVDLDVIVKKTERFSGADLKNMVEEARKVTAKEAIAQGKVIPTTMAHFMQVLGGIKPSTSLASLESYEQFRLDFERRTGAAKPKEEEATKEGAVKWEDVAGLDDVKQALLEAIELPLLHEAEMKEFKVKPSKGILLFGPPGTGKTLIVKAAAGELKASFQTISAAELMKKGYTQAAGMIKEIFNRARENPPGIIFVDEIETFAPARG